MNKRAVMYWEWGYNVYLIDNLGHGRSDKRLYPSGFEYSYIMREVIDVEKIKNPVLHGVSMGAIGASYIGQKSPEYASILICEAVANNFDDLYTDLLRFMKIPPKLFFWIDWVSRKIVWRQFVGKNAEYDVADISLPVFMIHSDEDQMFNFQKHFDANKKILENRENVDFWLVPNSKHTRMDLNPNYESKIREFISKYYVIN